MRRTLCGLTVAAIAAVLCGPAFAEKAPAALKADDFRLGQPLTHQNLTIFPIISRTPRNEDRYITLNEGLKKGLVEIVEVGGRNNAAGNRANVNPNPPGQAGNQPGQPGLQQPGNFNPRQVPGGGAQVNKLMLVNKSKKPLFLMAGEIIIGGRQDRVVGELVVIPPTKKPIPLAAFCVEKGRWANRDAKKLQSYLKQAAKAAPNGKGLALAGKDVKKLARDARMGKFVASPGNINGDVRRTLNATKSQPAVWKEVGKQNAKALVMNPTGAYTDNYASERTVENLNRFMKALLDPVEKQSQIVGVVAVINGRPRTMDLFGETPLFRKLYPKLLKSYALDAISHPPKPNWFGPPKAKPAAASKFLADSLSAKKTKSEKKGSVMMTTRDAKSVISFGAFCPRRGAVHACSFAK